MCTTLLLLGFLSLSLVSSFSSNTIIYQTHRFHSSSTELFGTIRFVGDATASYNTPPIAISTEDELSLSQFLYTSASDEVLCGAQTNTLLEDDGSGDQLWRCQQEGVEWFGMTVLPIFINRIEKNEDTGKVIVSIIEAQTEVENGGRLGNTLATAMKKSNFEGRNAVSWTEQNANEDDTAMKSYNIEGSLQLTLTIDLPQFLLIPPGFNAIGSKIVQTTCRIRLKQNLEDISNAYLQWHSSQDSLEETAETSTTKTKQISTKNKDRVNGDLKEEDSNISKDSDNHVETSTTADSNTAAVSDDTALENNIGKDDDNSKSEDTDNVVESDSEEDNNEGERIRKRDIIKRTLLGILE